MPDILIRDVPLPVVEALKARATAHRRSLQGELLTLLEQAASGADPQASREVATAIRERLARSGRVFGDSAILVREDRSR